MFAQTITIELGKITPIEIIEKTKDQFENNDLKVFLGVK